MRLLLLFKTSPESPTYKTPSSFCVQGEVLARGLAKLGVTYKVVDRRNEEEKAAAYKAFNPDFVVGIGYWGDVPEIVLHPRQYNQKCVPWLVPDGAVLDYQEDLNNLELILATSNWTKEVLVRDGVKAPPIKVVYEGVDTGVFKPLSRDNPQVKKFRERFKVAENQILIMTVGGDGKSKGFQEVISALKILGSKFSDWRYTVKVADSPTGQKQKLEDTALAQELGFQNRVIFFSEMLTKNDQACLFNAADIYASPSHNEGFGRPLVEAQSCAVPVLTVAGTTTKEIVRHGITGFAAKVKEELYERKFAFGERVIEFQKPKLIGVKADPRDLAYYLTKLTDKDLREKMGAEGRKFVLENFDLQVSAKKLVEAIEGTYKLKG